MSLGRKSTEMRLLSDSIGDYLWKFIAHLVAKAGVQQRVAATVEHAWDRVHGTVGDIAQSSQGGLCGCILGQFLRRSRALECLPVGRRDHLEA